jgi:hypothetical protein
VRKRLMILLGIAISSVAIMAMPVANASAASVSHVQVQKSAIQPDYDIICSGNYVCVQTASKSDEYATVNAWANLKSFTGHFELVYQGCGSDQLYANSTETTWPAGGKHFSFTDITWQGAFGCSNDNWAVIAWEKVSKGWDNLGTDAFQI